MSLTTTTHLNFRGQAREALEFYRSVFGGDLVVVTFADAPDPQDERDGADPQQVKWAGLTSPQGFALMAFDVPAHRPFSRGENAVFVSVRVDDAEELTGYYERLAEGAEIRTPLGPAGFSPLYAMLTDRFGITWVMDLAVDYGG